MTRGFSVTRMCALGTAGLAAALVVLLANAGSAQAGNGVFELCGGEPATIVGSGTIEGTPGPDVIVGSPGADDINARGGDDKVCARGGSDDVNAWTGNDVVNGEGGNDHVIGHMGDDVLRGNDGADTVDDFFDILGFDVLRGGGNPGDVCLTPIVGDDVKGCLIV